MMPGSPSLMMHQSLPGVRRRRVSHPSIHFPRSVYLSGTKMPLPAIRRFSLGAKNSSFAKRAAPPTRAEARSTKPAGVLPSPGFAGIMILCGTFRWLFDERILHVQLFVIDCIDGNLLFEVVILFEWKHRARLRCDECGDLLRFLIGDVPRIKVWHRVTDDAGKRIRSRRAGPVVP